MKCFLLCVCLTVWVKADLKRETLEYWQEKGRERLKAQLFESSGARPKNVIFFLGDGMGISIVSASRIYRAQKRKDGDLGKNHLFEDFPTSGLVKTHSFDYQVTDSAAAAVALFAGQKVEEDFLLQKPGYSNTCDEGLTTHINDGIAELALKAGMNVGFVTTTRITHATPAALYAKGVNRSLETDAQTKGTKCKDIASQLLQYPASEFKVLLGGGTSVLTPNSNGGNCTDGRDIRKEWKELGGHREVISTAEELKSINASDADYLLGTFSPDNFPFFLDQEKSGNLSTPRLVDMTEKALEVLKKEDKGFFLMVEGGLIDYGEHYNQLHLAFGELNEFELAIQKALEMTDPGETLIVVTADHSHALSLPGYMPNEVDILGNHVPIFDYDKVAESPKSMPGVYFAVGPGFVTKPDFDIEESKDLHFRTPAGIPMAMGAHGGDDVGIWTNGPGHRFQISGYSFSYYIMRALQLFSLVFVTQNIVSSHLGKTKEYWDKIARDRLDGMSIRKPREEVIRPKKVILFIGDGMGIATVTGARAGKARQFKKDDAQLDFEDFDYTGLVKTSSLSSHITDSAAGAVALLTGWKVENANLLTKPGADMNCSEGISSHINDGIPELALRKGVVTTTSLTHATPAATFAKGVRRFHENDNGTEGTQCLDIARQLLQYPANEFTVLMGGGERHLLPNSSNQNGVRNDNLNILDKWHELPGGRRIVQNKQDLLSVDPKETEHVLGVFESEHFQYHYETKDDATVVRLHEMTKKAIEILEYQSGDFGYFLLVEGGLIDSAEHKNQLNIAFDELYELELAVTTARDTTDPGETLILVTADHAHALTIAGYGKKDESILYSDPLRKKDFVAEKSAGPVPGMMFASGPGWDTPLNYTKEQADEMTFQSPSGIYAHNGNHGGEDVGIWSDGPGARFFSGTIENTQVAYTIKRLLCLGEFENPMDCLLPSELMDTVEKEPFRPSTVILALTTAVFAATTLLLTFLIITQRKKLSKMEKYNNSEISREEKSLLNQ